MAATTRVTVKLTTYLNLSATFTFHVSADVVDPNDPIITGLITVLEAITRGKAVHIEISLRAAGAGSPVSLASYVNEDKGFFRFKDDLGTGHNFKVPSPLTTIFLSDNENIDPSFGAVDDFIAAITTNAIGRGGDEITTFIKGYRKENRKLLKAGTATT